MSKFRVAAIQMPTVENKMENVKAVRHYLEEIRDQKIDFVVLPEMFCCPYVRQENFLSMQKKRAVRCGKLFLLMQKSTIPIWCQVPCQKKMKKVMCTTPVIFLTEMECRSAGTERRICLILM